MSIKLKKVKLDKHIYIYGIDKNINLSFEIESDTDENIEKISIFYGYNFYGNKQKHNAFQDKMIEENRYIKKGTREQFSFTIPINFFNFKFYEVKIENYINIEVKNSLFKKNKKEKIVPNIVIEEKAYGFKNLTVIENIDIESPFTNNDIQRVEELILKTDNKQYKKIVDEIKNDRLNIFELLDETKQLPIKGKEDEYEEISKRLDKLEKKKSNLFIVRSEKKAEYKRLIEERENSNYKLEKYDGHDFNYIDKLVNELNSINRQIYKCYSGEDDIEYNKSVDKFYDILYRDEDENTRSSLNHLHNKLKITEDIKNKQGDFVVIRKSFRGIFTGSTLKILETNGFSADYVHKDVYNKLKEKIIINIFDKLVHSKIYNFVYKYIFILPVLALVSGFFDNFLYRILAEYIGEYYIVIFLIFPITFLVLSKLLEILFTSKINKSIYENKLHSQKNMEDNFSNNLVNGNLKITDIFEKFNIKVENLDMDFNFNVSLDLIVETYHQEGKSTSRDISPVYSLDLFNYTGKGYFDLNKAELLKDDYTKLAKILPNSSKKAGSKVYYELNYKFDSSYIPDVYGKKILFLNFGEK